MTDTPAHIALKQAAEWFREYEASHRAKGADDKRKPSSPNTSRCRTRMWRNTLLA